MRSAPTGVLLLALLAISTLASTTSYGPPGEDPPRRGATAYWTSERMEDAAPAVPTEDTSTTAAPEGAGGPRSETGTPGTPSDETTTSVAGAEFQAGGLVTETTGVVFFTDAGIGYRCSGSVVEGGVVVTAGHCVHETAGTRTGWAENWVFVPGYDANTDCTTDPSACWTATALVTTESWHADREYGDDVAFAVVEQDSGAAIEDTVGSLPIDFVTKHESMYAFGYPAVTPYTGDDLAYCADEPVLGHHDGTVGIVCDLTGGISGGPWLQDFDPATGTGNVVSLASHRVSSHDGVLFGPVFDRDERAAHRVASRGKGNHAVRHEVTG